MTTEEAGSAPTPPRMNVLSQYVLKLAFENKAAARGVNPTGKPTINVQVDVDTKALANERHSVSLSMNVTAKSQDQEVFAVGLEYTGVFLLQNVPEDTVNAVLMVEAARLLFPFARRIIAETTRDGGYPPLMLDPIDFAALYRRRMAAAKEAEKEPATVN